MNSYSDPARFIQRVHRVCDVRFRSERPHRFRGSGLSSAASSRFRLSPATRLNNDDDVGPRAASGIDRLDKCTWCISHELVHPSPPSGKPDTVVCLGIVAYRGLLMLHRHGTPWYNMPFISLHYRINIFLQCTGGPEELQGMCPSQKGVGCSGHIKPTSLSSFTISSLSSSSLVKQLKC